MRVALAAVGLLLSVSWGEAKPLQVCRFATHVVCEWLADIPHGGVFGPVVETGVCATTISVPGRGCVCNVAGSRMTKQGLVLVIVRARGVTKCVLF